MKNKKIKSTLFITVIIMSIITIALFTTNNAICNFAGIIPCLIIVWCMKKYNLLKEKENQSNPQEQIEQGFKNLKENIYDF